MKFFCMPEGAYKYLTNFINNCPYGLVKDSGPIIMNSIIPLDDDRSAEIMKWLGKKAAEKAEAVEVRPTEPAKQEKHNKKSKTE